ncbi:MAG: hypothetical protein WA110_05955 [Anaerolineaceae bacterium]
MNSTKQLQPYRINMQFVLIGAALGLYYGISYKGMTLEPDYVRVVIWSLAAALITVIVRSWKKGYSFKTILLDFLKMASLYLLFLVGLEFRKQVDVWGGKTAVIVFTTIIGAIIGFILGTQKKPDQKQPPTNKEEG